MGPTLKFRFRSGIPSDALIRTKTLSVFLMTLTARERPNRKDAL
jgi:hypothetical protein